MEKINELLIRIRPSGCVWPSTQTPNLCPSLRFLALESWLCRNIQNWQLYNTYIWSLASISSHYTIMKSKYTSWLTVQSQVRAIRAAWLRCRVGVWEICVGQGPIAACRDAAGPLLRHEPMTLKSCAPRLRQTTGRVPETRHCPTAPSLLFLNGLRQQGLLGDNQERKSMSFIFQVPQSSNPTLTPPPSFPSQHQADTSRLTLICTSKPRQSLMFRPSADTNNLSRGALTSLTTAEGPHHFPTSYPNWQAVLLILQCKARFCSVLFWYLSKHMCHTGSQECRSPSAAILGEKALRCTCDRGEGQCNH